MKFEVGEIAVVVANGAPIPDVGPQLGEEVTVVAVGPFEAGVRGWRETHPFVCRGTHAPSDYYICDARGYHWFCPESRLRKRRPPQRLGSWDAIAEYTKWSPRLVEETA